MSEFSVCFVRYRLYSFRRQSTPIDEKIIDNVENSLQCPIIPSYFCTHARVYVFVSSTFPKRYFGEETDNEWKQNT